LREWLPDGHLAWFVIDAVEAFDLAAFYGRYRADGVGRPAFEPSMMVALLLYAYAVGQRSSRQIERRCVEDVAFRVVVGNLAPDHTTIARFRQDHEEALGELFGQVLELCREAGLVSTAVWAVDSTRIHANASARANLSYEEIAREILAEADRVDRQEDELFGERRGDELPPELADPRTRRQRLREAKARLDAKREQENAKAQARANLEAEYLQGKGRRVAGRKPKPVDLDAAPKGRVNVTDPDSRTVPTARGFIQGYSAQAVATDEQIVVAAEVCQQASDGDKLVAMIAAARQQMTSIGITQPPDVVLADTGYWSATQIEQVAKPGTRVLVAPRKPTKTRRRKTGPAADQMRAAIQSPDGANLYARRSKIIEPIFGDMKFNRKADRFQRRGLPACRSEWRLITTTHNLLKLWRATTQTA
jgi:transposase